MNVPYLRIGADDSAIENGYALYLQFTAVMQHWSRQSLYDYFTYQGRLKVGRKSFDTSSLKYKYVSVAKKLSKDSYLDFVVANFEARGEELRYFGDLTEPKAMETYRAWVSRNQNLLQTFQTDLNALCPSDSFEDFKETIRVPDGGLPLIADLWLSRKISSEFYLLLDNILGFIPYHESKGIADPLYSAHMYSVERYKPFLLNFNQTSTDSIKAAFKAKFSNNEEQQIG